MVLITRCKQSREAFSLACTKLNVLEADFSPELTGGRRGDGVSVGDFLERLVEGIADCGF